MVIETGLWKDVIGHPDYEIFVEEPHPIRKKASGKIVSESIGNHGYYRLKLDGKHYLKHRIIATQFIPNDDPALKIQVDHKNRDRTDNHISNLRWTTSSENNLNQSRRAYDRECVDELPEDAIEVDHYGDHNDISDLYFHDDAFYISACDRYRIAKKHQKPNG